MAKKSPATASPLTFDLPVSLIAKIEAAQRKLGVTSTSEVVRLAIANFNFERFEARSEEHRQISVRLPSDMKGLLTKHAKKKKVSVGEMLRVALLELAVNKLPKAEKAAKPAKKAAAKKARK